VAQPPIAYYITAHGYGHGTRSCDLLRALHRARPDIPLRVVTGLPRSFLVNRLPPAGWTLRAGSFDTGMVQRDSVRVDLPASRAAAEALLTHWADLVAQERDWLRREGVGLVVCDIPAIPLQAARAEGLPAVACGNFSWDWIYEPFAEADPRWQPVVAHYRSVYAQTDLLLRLPFSPGMDVFPSRWDAPLPAEAGRDRRAEIARRFGIDPGLRWVLLSFSSLDWAPEALRAVGAHPGTAWCTVPPLQWDRPGFHSLPRDAIPFSDTLASVDVVVSKPGFGILSECVANDQVLVYADREDFREYPVLVEAIQRHLRGVHIPAQDLYAGRLESALDAAARGPPPREPLPAGGAGQIAEKLLEMYRG